MRTYAHRGDPSDSPRLGAKTGFGTTVATPDRRSQWRYDPVQVLASDVSMLDYARSKRNRRWNHLPVILTDPGEATDSLAFYFIRRVPTVRRSPNCLRRSRQGTTRQVRAEEPCIGAGGFVCESERDERLAA